MSIQDFAVVENTKTKILTIAKEFLGLEETIEESMLNQITEDVIIFINMFSSLVEEGSKEDTFYIMLDLFVANIISISILSDRLNKVMVAYLKLKEEYDKEHNS